MISTTALLFTLLSLGGDPASGEIRVDSALLTLIEHADVSAREVGPLVQREAKEGDTVEQNGVLGKLDDQDAKLILERAETDMRLAKLAVENDIKIRFARKSLEVSQSELKRSLESVANFPKSVSQTELDRQRLLVEKATLEIEQASFDQEQAKLAWLIKKNDVDRASLQLERRTLRAPFPGMVVQWKRQRGEWIEPGTPVVRMIRLNRLRAEAFLASRNVPVDLVGRPVQWIVDLPEKSQSKFAGKLVFVHPEIDPVNGQVRIWAEIENTDMILRPGQTGTLVIGARKSTD
jgi:macrolide-specific efflux system membrane fusion protein